VFKFLDGDYLCEGVLPIYGHKILSLIFAAENRAGKKNVVNIRISGAKHLLSLSLPDNHVGHLDRLKKVRLATNSLVTCQRYTPSMNRLLILILIISSAPLCAQRKIAQTDIAILRKLESQRTPGMTKVMRVISDANMFVNIGVPSSLLIAGAIRDDKDMQQNGFYIATSTATTILTTFIMKKLVKRPRPFITHLNFTAVYQPPQYSFPSGHTSSAFATASALSMAYSKWYVIAPSLLWASSVGYSRMYLGVHYPSDVAAGAALGAGAAWGFQFMKP